MSSKFNTGKIILGHNQFLVRIICHQKEGLSVQDILVIFFFPLCCYILSDGIPKKVVSIQYGSYSSI